MTDDPTSNRPHPVLQAVLSSLDMTIESEMSLFRQYQTLASLPDVTAEAESDPHLLPYTTHETPDPEQVASPLPPSEEPKDAEQAPSVPKLELTDDIAEDLTPSELALFQVDTHTETAQEQCPGDFEQQEAVLESPGVDQSTAVSGAPLPAEEKGSDPPVPGLGPAIEDYLDSSTALRQHLEESAVETDAEPGANPFSPQKLLLLLGLSILGTLAVVLFLNVTGLRQKLWPPQRPQPQSTQSAASPDGLDPPVPSATQPDETSTSIVAAQGPDLSTKEFSDVNLGNLSRLQPSASPPSSTATAPTPSSSTPTPSVPLSQKPVPVVQNPASQTGLFYVVLPYTNAASLTQAQRFVPTAFLTTGSSGQQVQVGALETMEAAQRLAKQLRAQGLSAAIVAPN